MTNSNEPIEGYSKSGKRLGMYIYILPNLVTTANLFCGFYSIIHSIKGEFKIAAIAVVVAAIFDLLDQDLLCVDFDFASEHRRVQQLMNRYADLPTSLADACLVRMTELIPNSRVMTLDRDFTIYRRHGRQAIPLLSPSF